MEVFQLCKKRTGVINSLAEIISYFKNKLIIKYLLINVILKVILTITMPIISIALVTIVTVQYSSNEFYPFSLF